MLVFCWKQNTKLPWLALKTKTKKRNNGLKESKEGTSRSS
jgi:hypothetical protein